MCKRCGFHWLEVVGDPLAVVNGERVEDGLPAVHPADEILSVLPLLDGGEVEDFHGCSLGREVATVADRSPEPGVERFYGVGRVDDLA